MKSNHRIPKGIYGGSKSRLVIFMFKCFQPIAEYPQRDTDIPLAGTHRNMGKYKYYRYIPHCRRSA